MDAKRPTEGQAPSNHHYMLGMRLDYVDVDQFVSEFTRSAKSGVSAYCCVPDVYQCMVCHDWEDHRTIVNEADYVVSDSVILQVARALRHRVPAIRAVLGSDLMIKLCREAEALGVPIALIGGRDDEALAQITSNISLHFPDLRIAYGYSPPFRELSRREEEDMLDGLVTSGARLVFVGIGCPKQERWMRRYRDKVGAAMIGVGAAFDTIGGRVRPSPAFAHRYGLEWLFRLAREPRRLYRRYLLSAPRFVCLLLADWTITTFRPGPGVKHQSS